MNILYIGDIMGEAGIKTVEAVLPELIQEKNIQFVIAQAENVTNGKGLAISDYERLKAAGIQAFTGGNWTMHLDETHSLLNNPSIPVTRPANYPEGTPGEQYKIVDTSEGKILLFSLLGSIVGKDSEQPKDNPLQCADKLLNMLSNEKFIATIINFHGDFSSEKVVIGHYLDGRATAVIGDHWHVPTADARVLPHGTAHMTDVGMCGSLDSSLGVQFNSVIPRWRDNVQTRNILETNGRKQFNAALIEVNTDTQKAASITHIQEVLQF